jgi:hypothetical protein
MTARFNEMYHGDLETVEYHLETGECISVDEIQVALLNAIRHIRTLESHLERLQVQVAGIFDRESA